MSSIGIVSIPRVQDFTTIKQQEDNRAALAQTNLNNQNTKEIQNRAEQVTQMQETQWQQKKFDAREKGSNEYTGDGGKRRQSKQTAKVVVKGQQGFDMKI